MQRDVLIVGFGLAGWALTEALSKQGISFVVFDPLKNSSSRSATGVYNPVVLKRFRSIWNANMLMEQAIPFYSQPKYKDAVHPMTVHRVLTSVSEQNDWTVASDNPDLRHYLEPIIQLKTNANLHAPFGVGIVRQTGWVDTNKLLTIAQQELNQKGCFVEEFFDYAALKVSSEMLHYKDWEVNHVVFAEGVGVFKNPWFSKLPIIPNKGEWLIILCKGLELDQIVKGSVFIVPLGNDTYRVGATYAREFGSDLPTPEGKTWLLAQLRKLIDLPIDILHHGAGLRPTVSDRKPIIGTHPKHKNIWCINGLGSRGVLWAPYLATTLVNALNGSKIRITELLLRSFLGASPK